MTSETVFAVLPIDFNQFKVSAVNVSFGSPVSEFISVYKHKYSVTNTIVCNL